MEDNPLYVFLMICLVVNFILNLVGLRTPWWWIPIGIFAVLLAIAAAPATWRAVNKDRPNSILFVFGIAIVASVVAKVAGI